MRRHMPEAGYRRALQQDASEGVGGDRDAPCRSTGNGVLVRRLHATEERVGHADRPSKAHLIGPLPATQAFGEDRTHTHTAGPAALADPGHVPVWEEGGPREPA